MFAREVRMMVLLLLSLKLKLKNLMERMLTGSKVRKEDGQRS